MIRILQRSQLSLQEDIFPFFNGFVQISGGIAYEGSDHVPVFLQGCIQLLHIQQRLVVKMLQKHIFRFAYTGQFSFQAFPIKQLAYLEADFRIFVGIKRGNARLG